MRFFILFLLALLSTGLISSGCTKKIDVSKYYFTPQYQTEHSDILSFGFTFDWGEPVLDDEDKRRDELVSFSPAIRVISAKEGCDANLESIEIISKGEVEYELTGDDVVGGSEVRWILREVYLSKSNKTVFVKITTPCRSESISAEFEFDYVEKIEKVNFFAFMARQ